MNLLIFVISFLLIVASISYQSLAHYKANAGIRGIWERYMRIEEPCAFNAIVKNNYNKLLLSKGKLTKSKKQEEEEEDQDIAANGASAINLRFLIDPDYPQAHPKQTELMESVLKKLIITLYGDQVFFQNLYMSRPTILTELFQALRAANGELQDKSVKQKKNLSRLILKDPVLDELWTQLKRENPVSLEILSELFNIPKSQLKDDSPCYTISIIKFLSNSNVKKIRLFLASRAILLALLEDPALVDEILVRRKELYREVNRKTDAKSVAEATLEFQNFASKFPNLATYEEIITYTVTKTNPSTYE